MTDPELVELVEDRPSLLLREPVRVYVGGLVALVVGALVLAGVLTDEWRAFVLAAVPVVLGIPAAEAARASVYSPATVAGTVAAVQVDLDRTTVHPRPEFQAAVDAMTAAVNATPAERQRLLDVIDQLGQAQDTDGAHRAQEDTP